MTNRQHDWMFDQPMNLRSKQSPYRLDPQAIERRKRLAELEAQRELKKLGREVWEIDV